MRPDVGKALALYTSKQRKVHAKAVAETAVVLAQKHGLSVDKAFTAGILHDLARDYSDAELLALASHYGISVSAWERMSPVVLHGPVAAAIAKDKLAVNDEEILEAVSVHTLGAPQMSLLSKIVYLADVIEPGREFPGVSQLRNMAKHELNKAMLAAMDSSISYLLRKKVIIHPKTIEVRNAILIAEQAKEGNNI